MSTRLLVAEDESTLMETYTLPGTGVDLALQAEIERRAAALAAFIDGRRQVEVFIGI